MEAFLSSLFAVFIGEIGDKTQLLALFLAARYGKPWTISLGILIATLANHWLSGWFGAWVGNKIPAEYIHWIVSASFLLVAIWLLIPDKEDDSFSRFKNFGALTATIFLFFLAELGDKTQIATIILAAKFPSLLAVVAGTTVGMLLADVPVVFAGKWLMEKMPMKIAHRAAFVLFIVLAIVSFFKM